MEMYTSGRGGRDHLMTAVPMAMLILFAMFMAGGPKESLVWLENILRGGLEWLATLVR